MEGMKESRRQCNCKTLALHKLLRSELMILTSHNCFVQEIQLWLKIFLERKMVMNDLKISRWCEEDKQIEKCRDYYDSR